MRTDHDHELPIEVLKIIWDSKLSISQLRVLQKLFHEEITRRYFAERDAQEARWRIARKSADASESANGNAL